MTTELKLNTGRMFPDPDPKSDKHPIASGPCNIEGKEFRIALWKAESKEGKAYYNLKFSEMQEKPKQKEVVNDNIPF